MATATSRMVNRKRIIIVRMDTMGRMGRRVMVAVEMS